MYIEKIVDEDGEGFDWDVTVSDGEHKLSCFAGKEVKMDDKIELTCYFSEKLRKSKKKSFFIGKEDGYYGYKLRAKAVDVEKGDFEVYGFRFILDEYLPENMTIGDFLEFTCIRMDCEKASEGVL